MDRYVYMARRGYISDCPAFRPLPSPLTFECNQFHTLTTDDIQRNVHLNCFLVVTKSTVILITGALDSRSHKQMQFTYIRHVIEKA